MLAPVDMDAPGMAPLLNMLGRVMSIGRFHVGVFQGWFLALSPPQRLKVRNDQKNAECGDTGTDQNKNSTSTHNTVVRSVLDHQFRMIVGCERLYVGVLLISRRLAPLPPSVNNHRNCADGHQHRHNQCNNLSGAHGTEYRYDLETTQCFS
jgi:hypothetical protein